MKHFLTMKNKLSVSGLTARVSAASLGVKKSARVMNPTPLPELLEQTFERWKNLREGREETRNRSQAATAFFFGRLRKLITESPQTLNARSVVVALQESIEYGEL